jgi:glycosyltransferase involved in cell wall biosynthesis
MSVTIVIPAFDAERYLALTLDSVRNQTLSDWETIVVNDGSTDATAEIAQRYSQLDGRIRFLNQNNQGPAATRNNGLTGADTTRPLVLFLDADDLLEPNALEVLSDELAKFPEAPAVQGMARYISGEGEDRSALGTFPQTRVAVRPDGKTFTLDEQADTVRNTLVVKNCILSAGAVLIRKSALTVVGPWNPGFDGVEDLDMWYRLAGVHPIRYLPKVVLAYRVHGGSISRKREKMRRSAMRVRQEWLAHGNKEDRQLIRAGYRVIVRQGAQLRASIVLKALKARQWRTATRASPAAMAAIAKTFPGASDAFLFLQSLGKKPPGQ